jgi:hypothetical protein
MAEKTKVVLIQGPDNVVRGVRVGGAEISVLNAGPVVVPGGMGVALTIGNADITVEKPSDATKG